MSSQRLQKILAQAGIASRRAAERLITEGRVRVNGRIVRELGSRANPPRDRVEVDGKRLVAERLVYYLIHKPRGVVTTLDDPEGRKTIKDLLHGVDQRVFPVGRLDFQTSGALLLTNDGALAQALLHPTRAVPKTYNAKVEGKVEAPRLELLRAGVVLDDGDKTAPAEVNVLRTDDKATSLEITISEGKNRQIHRMVEAIGRTVLRLTRLSFAGLTLEGLRPGQLRPLHPLELSELKQKYVQAKPRRPRAQADEELDELELDAQDGELPERSAPPAKPAYPRLQRPARSEPARTRTQHARGRVRRPQLDEPETAAPRKSRGRPSPARSKRGVIGDAPAPRARKVAPARSGATRRPAKPHRKR